MLIKLPINNNNKMIFSNFNINFNEDHIVVENLQGNKMIDVIYKNNYGINTYKIHFPFKIYFYKNLLINEYFFIMSLILTEQNNLNFFYLLMDKIYEITKKKYLFINFTKIKHTNLNFLIEFLNKKNSNNDTMVNNHLESIYLKIQLYINISLTIMYLNNFEKIFNPSSRINTCIKKLNNYELIYLGIKDTFENHLKKVNKNEKKNNDYYFINDNVKEIKIFVKNITSTEIVLNNKTLKKSKYKISYYPENFTNQLSIKNIFKLLITHNLINEIKNIVLKKNKNNLNLTDYLLSNDFSFLLELEKNKINLIEDEYLFLSSKYPICNNHIDFYYFKNNLVNLEFDQNFFEELINNYTYPLDYNKVNISDTFKKILFYLHKFNKIFIKNKNKIFTTINTKYKFIFFYFIDMFSNIINDTDYFLFNYKIYVDNLYYILINKIFELEDLFNNSEQLHKYKTIYNNNLIIIQLVNLLDWKNIKKKINYLKFILKDKNNKRLILYENKINKNILYYNIDNKIKKILINPLIMFNYLAKKKDYIKWSLFLKDDINIFFYKPIKINEPVEILGTIIFLLKNIKKQDLQNQEYCRNITFLKKYNDILLFNGRINIKIKDIIKNLNLNLGILAKHLTMELDETISISSEEDTSIKVLKNKLNKMRRNYYKYKGKYLEMKMSEISSNITGD